MKMKRLLLYVISVMAMQSVMAQLKGDSFRAYLYNNEYEVYLRINLYDQNIRVPGQDIYGELPGYLGKQHNSFCWVVTSCKVVSEQQAEMQLINDFGSEDLTATLTRENDTTYVLRQGAGSTIKVPYKGKWRKLPKVLTLKRDLRPDEK